MNYFHFFYFKYLLNRQTYFWYSDIILFHNLKCRKQNCRRKSWSKRAKTPKNGHFIFRPRLAPGSQGLFRPSQSRLLSEPVSYHQWWQLMLNFDFLIQIKLFYIIHNSKNNPLVLSVFCLIIHKIIQVFDVKLGCF